MQTLQRFTSLRQLLASIMVASSILSPFALLPPSAEAQTSNESQLAAIGSQLAYLQSLLQTITGGVASLFTSPAASAQATITMGESTILSIDDCCNAGSLLAQQTTLSQTSTIQSLSFYVATAAGNLRLGVYDATGPGGGPGAKVAETNAFTPVVGWNTANIVTPVSLPAGTYWLAYTPSDNNLHFRRSGTGSFRMYSFAYGPLPTTFSTTPQSGVDHWSFYATLTTSSDTTPPSTPQNLQATAQSSSQINLTWNASTDNVAVTGYKVERCTGTSCSNFTQVGTPSSNSFNDTGLTAATTYRYQVRANDTAGNNSSYSTIASATTQAAPPPDTTPPTVSMTAPTGTTVSNTITVSANASDNIGVAGVQFLLDGSNLQAEDTTSPYSISWNTTTATNGSHTLAARARDAAGNTTTSAGVTVTVSNAVDTTPPSIPQNLQATAVSSSQINLTWTASTDNVGVTSYKVERCQGASCTNFAQIATPSTNSFSDTGLTAATTYRYQVRANDAAGNNSSYSTIASATTQVGGGGGITYYVSTSGSDSNPGTSALPWRTIQKAANTIVAGDITMVNAGNYGETVNTVRNGTAAGRITFRASGVASLNTFNFNHSYVTLDGFTFSSGINVNEAVTQGEILNNHLVNADIFFRYDLSPTNFLIKGNHIESTTNWGDDWPAIMTSGSGHLIENNEIGPSRDTDAFRPFGHDIIIRNNYVHDITLSSGSAAHMDVFQVYGVAGLAAYNIVFEKNLIDNSVKPNEYFQMCMTENNGSTDVRDFDVRNNIFIAVGAQCNVGIPGFRFYNNTVYNSGALNGLIMYLYNDVGKGDYTNAKIKNNLFVPASNISSYAGVIGVFGSFPGVERDYNVMTRMGTYGTVSGFNETNGINGGNPQFVNSGTEDFHLLSNSPAINRGVTLSGFANDYDGASRVAPWDIGAYEFASSPPPDTTPPTPPTNLQASAVSSSQTNLTWTASTDNVAVTSYKVERCQGSSCTNFTQVATPSTNSFNDTGLTANTTYRYQVRATDAANNNSSYSTIAQATTQASAPLQGDLNSDGTVNTLDWSIMNSQWFTSNLQSDINADGIVNSIDFGLMNRNWGLSG